MRTSAQLSRTILIPNAYPCLRAITCRAPNALRMAERTPPRERAGAGAGPAGAGADGAAALGSSCGAASSTCRARIMSDCAAVHTWA